MWLVRVSLLAIEGEPEVPEWEVRRYYHGEIHDRLFDLMETAPRIEIGTTEVTMPENDGRRGPVGRALDLLYLRGTTPSYRLLRLDEALLADLIGALTALPHDPPFEVVSRGDLKSFLRSHLGCLLVDLSEAQPGFGSAPVT
jgi:hypothetical protein